MKKEKHRDKKPESNGLERVSARGVFWIIEGESLAIKYVPDVAYGVSKVGENYNHKQIGDVIKPHKCNKPYNYYPRGRVETDNKGRSIIYLSIDIRDRFIPGIMKAFNLPDNPRIHYDGSGHYKSCLDQ